MQELDRLEVAAIVAAWKVADRRFPFYGREWFALVDAIKKPLTRALLNDCTPEQQDGFLDRHGF